MGITIDEDRLSDPLTSPHQTQDSLHLADTSEHLLPVSSGKHLTTCALNTVILQTEEIIATDTPLCATSIAMVHQYLLIESSKPPYSAGAVLVPADREETGAG